eukprot:2740337-Pyramimonas_sp.AAC.1
MGWVQQGGCVSTYLCRSQLSAMPHYPPLRLASSFCHVSSFPLLVCLSFLFTLLTNNAGDPLERCSGGHPAFA